MFKNSKNKISIDYYTVLFINIKCKIQRGLRVLITPIPKLKYGYTSKLHIEKNV